MRSSVVGLGLLISLGSLGTFAGCGFRSSAAQGDDAPGDGAPGVDACVTFASQVDTCKLAFDSDLTLSGTITYDTGTHELKVDGTAMPVAHMTLTTRDGTIDAIFARNVRITSGAGLRATGTLPFGIIASGSVTLEDASQINVGNGGAGALAVCSNPPMAGGSGGGGAAGGGGGGYGAAGGNGSDGNSDGPRTVGGAKSNSIGMPMGPYGGCPGAAGGAGSAVGGGSGGLGGGALYIAAAERIDLGTTAALTAGGGGGHGGPQSGDGGGGGGGSGGMIVLDAPHVIGPQARVAANGGGGGEGSNDSQRGDDGDNGLSVATRASGGAGLVADGTDGGRGGSMEDPTGETVTMRLTGGGGGGGGGVGYIHIESADPQLGSVSPVAQ
jgi:hypothetical protein